MIDTQRRKILFASYHSLIDPSSGAAISARELLKLLAVGGWKPYGFYGPMLDFARQESPLQLLADQGIEPSVTRHDRADAPPFRVAAFEDGAITTRQFLPEDSPGKPSREVGLAFLAGLDTAIREWRPDFVLTYGGFWLAEPLQQIVRSHGVKLVFWLRNFAYSSKRFFNAVDLTLVPSECSRRHYMDEVGIESTAIPSPLDWDRVACSPDPRHRFVTFVNPQPHKGVFVLARIAQHLGRRRPDIPLLVVEGRSGIEWLARTGVDLSQVDNVHMMTNTPDPRDFYRASRVVLMPSLWRESFGRIAAEAMINGIPVLGTDRGALPEVIEGAGLTFPISKEYTPETRVAPPTYEVRPWVDAIIRLWDDDKYHDEISGRCRERAEQWRPEKLFKRYEETLIGIL